MEKIIERNEFLKAAKNINVVIWPILDSRGAGWKACTSDETYAIANTHAELVAKLDADNITWIDGVL